MRRKNLLLGFRTQPHTGQQAVLDKQAGYHERAHGARSQRTSTRSTSTHSTGVKQILAALTTLGLGLVATGCGTEPNTSTATTMHTFEMPLPQGASLITARDFGGAPTGEVTLGSLAPDSSTVAERIPEILERGRLIVGVEQSQYLLAYRNAATGKVEGFEVDIAREIAKDIFQDPNAIEFRFINTETWLSTLASGEVDFVINSISISRSRQDQAFFSTPYFRATTRLLVPSVSEVEDIADLGEVPVCVTKNSTGGAWLAREYPDQNLLVVTSSADCLLALQQNQAGAILSDDTILSGMMQQDPFTRLTATTLGRESYGIAFAKPTSKRNTTGLVRQVNSTLERIFADGTWNELANGWLSTYLNIQSPPALFYRSQTETDQLVPDRSTVSSTNDATHVDTASFSGTAEE